MKKKICFITGSRAEYGLLYPLINKIRSSGVFRIQIVATGMHLSPAYGLTFREIEKDGFKIDRKVKMLLSGDSPVKVSKSVGLGCIGFADVFARLKPDLAVVLGDRFEVFSAVISAYIAKIPIAHIHGGELTEGAMDEAFRHSITKMSCLHFTSTGEYRRRVIQLGEAPDRVFNVGALGLDNIRLLKLLSKKELERKFGIKFGKKTALVTFHPVTLGSDDTGKQLLELLKALDGFKGLNLVFTMPNADPGNRVISKIIKKYVSYNPDKARSFVSLGRLAYLSVLKHSDVVVGNSSSGIIEAPSLATPTVNIGNRQKGRVSAKSVINCAPESGSIEKALKKALSPDFISRKVSNPYGNGRTAEKICAILVKELKSVIKTNKTFYNLRVK